MGCQVHSPGDVSWSKREVKKGLYIIRSAHGQGVKKVIVNK